MIYFGLGDILLIRNHFWDITKYSLVWFSFIQAFVLDGRGTANEEYRTVNEGTDYVS